METLELTKVTFADAMGSTTLYEAYFHLHDHD